MVLSAALGSLVALAAVVNAQQVGTQVAERHPALSWQQCTKSGCTNTNGAVVLDANWRWLHTTSGYTNCYTGNSWDASLCGNGVSCANNCALDGADYQATYGITTSGNALTLKFKTADNVGSRVFLMASDTAYQMFKPKNKEFTFDVDLSQLGCGLNGALYFSEMEADGGMAKFRTNKAGAKYGTGYCDSQCPHDLKFINGEANVVGWSGSDSDPNSGAGQYGACCNEMDLWEANSMAAAYTPHGCTVSGPYRCQGTDCGDGDNRHGGVCDKDGCDFNSYRMGNTSFYGKGMSGIDTTKKFTVVTQFITNDNTANGRLSEIRRLYVQNGRVLQNSMAKNIPGIDNMNSITEGFCAAQKATFGDVNDFQNKGGFTPMDKAFTNGMVLVMSVWDDHAANMLWLDSTYPTDSTGPGAARGACATTSGAPRDVESQQANAQVIFSNIKFGDIGTTYSQTGTPAPAPGNPSSAPAPQPTAAPTTAPLYGQCGGQGWNGPTVCASGTCKASNQYYSQCLP